MKVIYGAVAYGRCVQTNDPLKSTGIPRLKLCGTVLGGEVRVLKVDMREVTMNVLYRIYGQSWLFKSVVKNRFGEIQTQLDFLNGDMSQPDSTLQK